MDLLGQIYRLVVVFDLGDFVNFSEIFHKFLNFGQGMDVPVAGDLHSEVAGQLGVVADFFGKFLAGCTPVQKENEEDQAVHQIRYHDQVVVERGLLGRCGGWLVRNRELHEHSLGAACRGLGEGSPEVVRHYGGDAKHRHYTEDDGKPPSKLEKQVSSGPILLEELQIHRVGNFFVIVISVDLTVFSFCGCLPVSLVKSVIIFGERRMPQAKITLLFFSVFFNHHFLFYETLLNGRIWAFIV